MAEKSTLEIFRGIAEPLLRQLLFLSSLVLLAIGRVTEGALVYLFVFTLNWARTATRVRKASSIPPSPEILAALPGRRQVLVGRAVRILALAGVVLWIYEFQVPFAWCVVPALLAALGIDAAMRSRDLLREVFERRSIRAPALVWFGVFLGVATDVPAVLLNLFIAIPTLDFLRPQ